ncbi:MATE family efflux transporter [Domibacillus epiphyticus]|uniref:MATE family efflux transporter n=1 Tax=Domibacillus epiphyticus TaxID=1714355 RepID=A0A1V2A869_9BACI|nr:MATE family efflux transporter [Domibacillus epiphyticus]OMP67199.1 MATE family efflux transporter [Domibacillus epiphyticus]
MKHHDFTSGNIWRQLLVFSAPILLTNLLQVSYQLIDSFWVGNLIGANALGAVAVSSTVLFTVLSLILGINNAALTILSQLKGRDEPIRLKRYVNAFTVCLTGMSIALGLVGFFLSDWLLRILGTPEAMISDAVSYLQINFIGILFLFGYNFIGTVFRALGNSKTPIRFVVMALLLNAVLDPLFIHTFQWGIDGAAYATIVSQGAAFLYGLIVSIREKLIPFSIPFIPKREEVMLILNQGIPAGFQMMAISAGMAAIMSVVTSFGNDATAGFGAAQRLDSLLMLPAHAIGTAVNSIAGQNIAAGQWKRVHRIAFYAVILNTVIMLAAAIGIVFFAEKSIRLFISDPEAVTFGAQYILLIAFFYPFLGINFVLNGIVRASGAMLQILLLNIISFWVLRYPLTFLFAEWIGEKGIAYGMGVSFMISSIFAISYYRFGNWKSCELFKKRNNNEK